MFIVVASVVDIAESVSLGAEWPSPTFLKSVMSTCIEFLSAVFHDGGNEATITDGKSFSASTSAEDLESHLAISRLTWTEGFTHELIRSDAHRDTALAGREVARGSDAGAEFRGVMAGTKSGFR